MAEKKKSKKQQEQGGAKKASAKSVSKAPEVPFSERLSEFTQRTWDQLKDLGRSLFSPDRPTRRMSFLFFVSLAGVFAVLVKSALYFSREPHHVGNVPVGAPVSEGIPGERTVAESSAESISKPAQMTEQQVAEFIENRPEQKKSDSTMFTIGLFEVEIRPLPVRERGLATGAMNLAQMELVAECDSKEACGYLKQHQIQVRNQVLSALTGIQRDGLLTREGKRKIKEDVSRKINGWLASSGQKDGKVETIYFSKLIIE